jgi:hypothetical protein
MTIIYYAVYNSTSVLLISISCSFIRYCLNLCIICVLTLYIEAITPPEDVPRETESVQGLRHLEGDCVLGIVKSLKY